MDASLKSDLMRLAEMADALRDSAIKDTGSLQALKFATNDDGVVLTGNASGLIELARYALQVASGSWHHAHIDQTNFAVESIGELTLVSDAAL